MGIPSQAYGKGKAKTGKGPDNAARAHLVVKDASKGKGKADVDDAYWNAKGKGWALQYKACLGAELEVRQRYPGVPKGGPPMQQVYAFSVKGPRGGTDVFFSHQYVMQKDSYCGEAFEYYELWYTPKPKHSWWASSKHDWIFMGRCTWKQGDVFKPLIWGRYGAAIRTLRGF